ncbi:MAG: hypothetical protein KF784_14565 [Fimbriimonadaceae bacterium]|nr:hypothetical protein [Fimbriimonadaceae bacterium]
MAAVPNYYRELPREIVTRLHDQFSREDWGCTYVVTLNYDGVVLPTPVMYEVDEAAVLQHNRTMLILIGCVLPDKLHLLLRAGSLTPGRFKRFEEALRDLKDATSASTVRLLKRPGHLYADRNFIRPVESEEEMYQFALQIYKSPLADDLCTNPMRYPHLLLP